MVHSGQMGVTYVSVSSKTIDPHRGRAQAQPRISAARNSEMYDSRNLSRNAVEGQRRNQAHDRLRGFGRQLKLVLMWHLTLALVQHLKLDIMQHLRLVLAPCRRPMKN
jgi:hypothetical protein